jgi:pilus assembly protein Flp/PilA
VRAFAVSQSGATAIEYALIAGSISIAIVTAVSMLGQNVLALFQSLADKM